MRHTNVIYPEDCRHTMQSRGIGYDYVFCVPPDLDELGLNPSKDLPRYYAFLESVFSLLAPSTNIVTIAITDRKHSASIIPKHAEIIDTMARLGYRYISQKVWCRSYKVNLYRLNYSFVMSFAKGPIKQNHHAPYEEDVWNNAVYCHKRYRQAISLAVVTRCVMNFTQPGHIVYDPFMGSGTTAIACLETSRVYIGSEIDNDTYELGQDRIKVYLEKEGYMHQKELPLVTSCEETVLEPRYGVGSTQKSWLS